MPNSRFLAAYFFPLQVIQISGNKCLKRKTFEVTGEVS